MITRSDITFIINQLFQHMHNPSNAHFQFLKKVLRYIKGMIGFGLPILSGSLRLSTYSDSNWASEAADR